MRGCIRERKGRHGGVSYELRVYVGTNQRTGNKEYATETFRGTRRQAETRLARLITEHADGNKRRAGKKTFATLWADYEEAVLPALSPNTARGYRRIWQTHLQGPLGWRDVTEIDPQTLERLYASLAKTGSRNGGPLKERTVRNVHVVVASLLATAARWGWVTTPHAADRAKTPPVPIYEPTRAPESRIIKQLIAAAMERGPAFAAMLRLAAVTGARPAELCALRWNDLDVEALTITIDEAVKGRNDEGDLIIGDTKTHQQRTIALDAATLNQVLALMPDDAAYEDYVFVAQDGVSPIDPNAWSQRWTRLRKHVKGAEKVRLYDLRHWQGTVGAEKAGAQIAQHRLGHSRLSTTGIYVKTRQPADAAAADAIAAELS